MWLINTATIQLEEFVPEQAPPYAILSHRWEEDEVLFRHMQNPRLAKARKGYTKVEKTCVTAAARGLSYVWVDTCCINKDSSAELSEAINSMFGWYARSDICLVYLRDVKSYPLEEEELASSVWFTRGWTLQELLAPRVLSFYNTDWRFLGFRSDLPKILCRISNIPEEVLNNNWRLSKVSVAGRMSWASSRITTRLEDQAYCLLGIFQVNMPLIYGEGKRAFLRLQEEIIRRNNDITILFWRSPTFKYSGPLASSPEDFKDMDSWLSDSELDWTHNSAFALTNQGLSIQLPLKPCTPLIYMASFSFVSDWDEPRVYSIFFGRSDIGGMNLWSRINLNATAISEMPRLRWRGWQHTIHESTSRSIEMVIDKKFVHSRWSGIALEPWYKTMLQIRYKACVKISPTLESFIKCVTRPKTIAAERRNSGQNYEVLTAPYCTETIRGTLHDEQYGIIVMIEFSKIADCLHHLAFGVDFEGTPFVIARKRQQLPDNHVRFNQAQWKYIMSLEEARRDEKINVLIDRDPKQPSSRHDEPQSDLLQWQYPGFRHPGEGMAMIRFPEGVWAFKGYWADKQIQLCSKHEGVGRDVWLTIEPFQHDVGLTSFTVQLTEWEAQGEYD